MPLKVLVIGLDGATWDLIKPWADEEKLPTFKKLMENGTWGYLESTIPPWTIPAWESMTTGLSPKKLGFATWIMVKDGYRFVPHIYKHRQYRRVWDILSDFGYNVIVANLPNVYVAQKIRGVMVAGWLCSNKDRITYPPSLIKELDKQCNGYRVDILNVDFEKGQIIRGPKDYEYLRSVEELLEKHFSAFTYLLKNYKWDFGFIVFVTPDRIQHKYWDNNILLEHYKKIDEKLEHILKMLDDETIVFLVSDHGFGPVKYTLNINEFLMREGYLKLKNRKQRRSFISTLYILIKKIRLLPLAKMLINLLPHRIAKHLRVQRISFEKMDIDWGSTKAFGYGVWGDIYLNIKSREPNGIVDPEEYDRVRNEILEKIRNLEYNGVKLNIKVLKKEEAYPGSTLWDDLPDLIILPTDEGVQSICSKIGYNEVITETKNIFGNHRLYGIFLAYGKGVRKGYRINNVKIYDIAPTILHIFGLPIPKDADGRVLREIFEDDSEFAKREPKYIVPSEIEKEKIRRRIRELKKQWKK